jgi:3-(3-hydroxy-phenyl)propionate hydroxylase
VVEDLLADIVQNTPIRYHTSWGRCFAHVKPSAQPFGFPRRNLFLQPLFETTLRGHVKRYATVDMRFGTTLDSFVQDETGVSVKVRDASGAETQIRASFLVGADGGKSLVRQSAGLRLLGTTAPVKWLVVDVADDQLNAPYSAVYCDPKRPVLVIPLPYGHRRFEFKLQPDDDENDIIRPERVRELLAARYGDLPLPKVLRSQIYLHHSRVAESFQAGRVFLAGDAAHLQPPFFGQGMNSGIRDATNLAWKLAAVIRGMASRNLLSTYDMERRNHAAAMVSFATRIGRMYSPRSRATERIRDLCFRGLQLIPGGKEYILQMKYKPMPRYTTGLVTHQTAGDRAPKASPVGRMFLQPDVETAERERLKLDGALGPWFAVLGLGVDPRTQLSEDAARWWQDLGARFVRIDPSRSAVHREQPAPPPADADLLRLQDVDGAFRDWLLARPHDEIIVLRPDRYVAACCARSDLEAATDELRRAMG